MVRKVDECRSSQGWFEGHCARSMAGTLRQIAQSEPPQWPLRWAAGISLPYKGMQRVPDRSG